MTRRRVVNKNPLRVSTQDERTLSTFITLLRAQKKKVLNLASTPIWKRLSKYFWGCLAFRLFSAFCIHTEFVPDEAWQSTEVGYYYTFGPGNPLTHFDGYDPDTPTELEVRGHGHLTWEWIVGLRNHLYPVAVAGIPYHLLKLLGWDSPYSLIMVPRLLQATLTALGDYALFLYATVRYGGSAGKWTLGLSLSNWFLFYTGPRTITNSAEMALNSIALLLLQREQIVWMTAVVTLNFVIRPTALVIWIPQLWTIFRLFYPPKVAHRLTGAIFVGSLVMGTGAVLDTFILGRPTIAWIRFLRFNVLEGGATQFGKHHVLWYFYSAIPSIFGVGLMPLIGSLTVRVHEKEWLHILCFIATFCLLPHKEIRFLLPILPMMLALMGDLLQKCWEIGGDKEVCRQQNLNIRALMRNWVGLWLISNFLAVLYFCGFHQGGIIPSTQFVNTHAVKNNIKDPHIWVIMQCYTIPVYTYMHNPAATFEMMTCAPPNLERMGVDYSTFPNLGVYSNFTTPNYFVPNTTTTTTAHSIFNPSPPPPPPAADISAAIASAEFALAAWVRGKFLGDGEAPDFIICWKSMVERILKVMARMEGGESNYERCFSHPHAQFGEDRGIAVVLCRIMDEDV